MSINLYQEFCKTRNLEAAWKSVRSNIQAKGPGEKPLGFDRFEENTSTAIRSLQSRLSGKSFKFSKQKGVLIQKGSGGSRPLVISTLEDRVVHRAILNVLQSHVPAIQNVLKTPSSYGAIPKDYSVGEFGGVSAAINKVRELFKGGFVHYYRSDIPSFFTKVKKCRIDRFIESSVDDEYFVKFFKQAMEVSLENSSALTNDALSMFPDEKEGISQGSPLSPLMANIYLYDFDSSMIQHKGCECLRYLDDILILAKSRDELHRSVDLAIKQLKKVGLELYSQDDKKKEKYSSGDVNSGGFEFLGCSITNGSVSPSASSRGRLLENINSKCNRFILSLDILDVGGSSMPMTYPEFLEDIRRTVTGWAMSYRFCNNKFFFEAVDKKVSLELDRVHARLSKITKNRDKFYLIYGVSTSNIVFPKE
ncbi:reverse transcriptase/maturase family protein [Halomonas sp. M5N1S17]|uniref:reverse transcriptase domain-containing protein n=1 Tax=Halomonas alkalisoli TaxID=2907158 RepID=UPI001F22D836|nr:reverse transcriptase domain-containing protein [Halomonas alkalisoli]MCE9666130.1 reverse transcriptase/maturase family protein [Halomonas alkalisoli]